MPLRILLSILIVAGCVITGTGFLLKAYQIEDVPEKPCTSIIKEGYFIDSLQQHYRFNGSVTWWPRTHRISLFGLQSDQQKSLVFDRVIHLENVHRKDNIIQGKVKETIKASADQLPNDYEMIAENGQDISLVFKHIDARNWLVMLNDNWVMMCEYK